MYHPKFSELMAFAIEQVIRLENMAGNTAVNFWAELDRILDHLDMSPEEIDQLEVMRLTEQRLKNGSKGT